MKLEELLLSNISKNIIVKIFVGDTTIDKTYEKNNIVYLKCNDFYEGLSEKVCCSIKWLLDTYKTDYLFKTDDDISIDWVKLYHLFTTKVNNKVLYAGNIAMHNHFKDINHCNKCNDVLINKMVVDINFNGIYCSGGGYFIASNILKNQLPKYLYEYEKNNILSEDLLMGKCLADINIIPTHLDYKNILDWAEPISTTYYFHFIRSLLIE